MKRPLLWNEGCQEQKPQDPEGSVLCSLREVCGQKVCKDLKTGAWDILWGSCRAVKRRAGYESTVQHWDRTAVSSAERFQGKNGSSDSSVGVKGGLTGFEV